MNQGPLRDQLCPCSGGCKQLPVTMEALVLEKQHILP